MTFACAIALGIPGALALDQTFVVTSAADNDDGTCSLAHCTLREAINAANAAAGHDTIQFDIPGAGVHTIVASSASPIITSPVTINATTEFGYSGTPLIEFNGNLVPGGNGLWFNSGTATSTVRGLALTSWEGAGVLTQASTTVILLGNYLGISPDGVTARPNLTGVTFLGGSDHVVGGPGEGQGNLISGNTQAGIRIQDVSVATIQGNRIGTNAAGTAARANSVGIEIFPTTGAGASEIGIGDNGANEGNLISGNTTDGIRLSPSSVSSVTDTTILSNRIGTDAAGAAALANGENGIEISGGAGVVGATTGTQIGRTGSNEGNTIAFNGQDGVHVGTNAPAAAENNVNSIRGNSIHSNGGLGIDLAPNGVTANDPPANLDADNGPNDLQNFPVLVLSVNGTINGELDSEANQGFSIDIYSSPSCDATNGEGRVHVDELLEATTDGSGHLNFQTTPTLPYPSGVVTATATGPGGTSEFSPCFQAPVTPQPGPTFTVNTTADATPADAGCSTADCTLREAMVAANTQVGGNTIAFDIPGAAPYTITPATALPAITDQVTIDGETEPQFAGAPVVELNGTAVTAAPGASDGLIIQASPTTIRGLVINRFADSEKAGIFINVAGGNVIEGNYIGTDVTGAVALPNRAGIRIQGGNNVIGGDTAADRNVISGNLEAGVQVNTGGANLIRGNYIGTTADGLDALGNGTTGVELWTASNVVGGATAGVRNVISGNPEANVRISGDDADQNSVQGNYIGTNADGGAALGGGNGVYITFSADNNTLGGGPTERNVISGNSLSGVEIDGAGTGGNVVQANYIGLDATGMTAVPNAQYGLRIHGSGTNEILSNLITGNGAGGVSIGTANPVITASQEIDSNGIGINEAGDVLTQPGAGISIANSSDHQIISNTIAGHSDTGVLIDMFDGESTSIDVRFNSIKQNTGLGIELSESSNPRGVTPNDEDDADGGPNELQNFPELTSAVAGGVGTTVQGTLHSTANTGFDIDFFASPTCDPSGNGEGATYLSTQTVTTDASGNVSFSEPVPPPVLAVGTQITATATGSDGTSEFSQCATVQQAVSEYTVNSNEDLAPDVCDAAACTLREAILAANGDGTVSTIQFALSNPLVVLNSTLPTITSPVTIFGLNFGEGAQRVVVDGSGPGVDDGLVLGAGSGGSTVNHIELVGFDGTGNAALRVLSNGNTVKGTEISGVGNGIVVEGGGGNTIGGSFPVGDGNRIWNFTRNAIELDTAAAGNVVAGNTIGIDSTGVPQPLLPGTTGIFVMDTPSPVIGHNAGPGDLFVLDYSQANVVVGTSKGIFFEAGVTGAIVAGNYLGVNRSGVPLDLETPTNGLELSGASDNNQLGPGNTIAHNGAHGIRINHSGGNRIVANSIHSNGGLGISLNSANGGIAAPALFNAFDTGANTAFVSGSVDGPNGSYVVEFFENATCDGSGNGEGEIYRGFTTVEITNGLSASFADNTFPGVELGDVITATSTRFFSPLETSEFSNCKTVVVEAAAPPPAPVLFGAVADIVKSAEAPQSLLSPSLGVAGVIDSDQPGAGQTFDVDFYTAASCAPGAPSTLHATAAGFVTNADGIAGFAKQGLPNVLNGTAIIATATRGGQTSQPSNCVIADRNNTAWHTAHPLDANETDNTGALRSAGQARWFKVPILPNSRVNVSLSSLPADYDLVVFSDIRQAYERLVGTDFDPTVGPNLAITDLNRAGAETQTDVFNTSKYDSASWDPTNYEPDLNTSIFSASEWSPSEWSASEWSASQWSPSEWSPSEWSASEWSPSEWSASEWSPSEWSASQWSPSEWSPSEWSASNPADPRAFSAAQTASLLAVSAGSGTGAENLSINTWNNTGDFYIRVQGKNGSFDADSPFSLSVARQGNLCSGVNDIPSLPVAATGLDDPKTLILRDSRRLAGDAFLGRLQTLAARQDVRGHIVDVDADLTVRQLNVQADGNASCPFAKNLVASAIKRIVDAYREEYPSIQYIVVVGGDDVIPFQRYPDPALLGNENLYVPPVRDDTASQASLRLGYILSDDFYAAEESVRRKGADFPVPNIPIGRLVETPQEIAGMLDAYLGTANGVVTPTSSLTTGYDFLTDAADEIAGHLGDGIGQTGANRTLITNPEISPATVTEPNTAPTRTRSWTADDLRGALLGPQRNDLIFLAGHFSANDALAADYKTNVLTTELPRAATNMVNSIVFSAGCHAGYNIVNGHATTWTETLDWAQAFAQKQATLIAGTGYQYGDTDFLAHGELIYAEFARQLRVSTQPNLAPEPVPVGRALLRSKQIFLDELPGLTALDEKSFLQTTLFGLPMLSVNMPEGRVAEQEKDSIVPEPQPVSQGPGADLELKVATVENIPANVPAAPESKVLNAPDNTTVPTTFYRGPDGVAVRPTQPILPLKTVNVTPTDASLSLRGVGFRGGSYVDEGGTTPLTAAPATELRGVHAPFFSDVFFPTQPWNVSYFSALEGGPTFLHLTPVQHRSESPTMTRRVFEDVDLDFFYSGNRTSYCPTTGQPVPAGGCVPVNGRPVYAVTPALAAPPTLAGVQASLDGTELNVRARVVGDPFAGVQKVWVTWTIPPGAGQTGVWQSFDLTQDEADETLWEGSLDIGQAQAGDVHFVVQAVNGVGRHTVDDNLGATYRPGSIPGIGAPPGQTLAATELEVQAPASVVYRNAFAVTVRLTSEGEPVQGALLKVGFGANGLPATTGADGRATVNLQATLQPGPYSIVASYGGGATYAPASASASIDITRRPTTLAIGGDLAASPNTVHATLEAVPSQPLHQRSVFFVFTGTGTTNSGHTDVFAGKTDPSGVAEVTDEFLSSLPLGTYRIDAYFNGVNLPGVLVLPEDSPEYEPATATATTLNLRAVFSGFFSPVDNPPTLNTVQAGRTVPVKFSLGGDRGLAIFQAGYPKVTTVLCSAQAPTDAIETPMSTSASSLTFDATTGHYTYLWKTDKRWTGCRQLTLRFADGTERFALFRFTK